MNDMFSPIYGIGGKQRSEVCAAMCFYTLSTWSGNSSNAVIRLGLSLYQ